MFCVASLASRRSVLAVRGDDVLAFLNNLICNDVRLLRSSSINNNNIVGKEKQEEKKEKEKKSMPMSNDDPDAVYGSMPALYTGVLNPKGRVICEGFLYKDEPRARYLFECDLGAREHLLAHVKRYKLRSKIALEDITDRTRVYVAFPSVASAPRDAAKDWTAEGDPASVFQSLFPGHAASSIAVMDPRMPSLGYRFLLDSSDGPDVRYSDKFVAKDPSMYDIWRFYHGIPEGVKEIPPDEALPFEANFDYTNAVNFHKGCYIGQELTARTFYTGVTRKRAVPIQLCPPNDPASLERIRGSSEPLYDPAFDSSLAAAVEYGKPNILAGDSKATAGKLLNTVGNVGLALLRLEHVTQRLPFSLQPSNQPLVPFIPQWWPKLSQDTNNTSNTNTTSNTSTTGA